MKRRKFLELALKGSALCALMPLGCGDTTTSTGQMAPEGGPVTSYSVGGNLKAWDSDGNEYRTKSAENIIEKLAADGETAWQAGGLGQTDGKLNYPEKIIFDDTGAIYGGDGNARTTFAVPDLASPDGGKSNYYIAATGVYPNGGDTTTMENYTGEISLFPYNIECDNWMACDGATLNINSYPALFNLIGTDFGGDDTTFNLPNLASPDEGKSNYFICSGGVYPEKQ